jgi:hypothetical protein
MGALIVAALIAAGVFGYEKSKAKPAGPQPQPPVPAGPVDSTGTGPTNISNPAPVKPYSPPIPAGPLGPGLYPAGTIGAFPVLVQVVGGDGDSYVTAAPGGVVGPAPGSQKTFWYGPGTSVVFSARVDGFAPFTAFDHFEGPGVSVHQNPIAIPGISSAGFVRGVFAFMGRPGG